MLEDNKLHPSSKERLRVLYKQGPFTDLNSAGPKYAAACNEPYSESFQKFIIRYINLGAIIKDGTKKRHKRLEIAELSQDDLARLDLLIGIEEAVPEIEQLELVESEPELDIPFTVEDLLLGLLQLIKQSDPSELQDTIDELSKRVEQQGIQLYEARELYSKYKHKLELISDENAALKQEIIGIRKQKNLAEMNLDKIRNADANQLFKLHMNERQRRDLARLIQQRPHQPVN